MASLDRAEPLVATASQFRSWLLVEVRGAWGRDAVVDSDLGPHVDRGWCERMRAGGIRVIAIRRDLDLCRGPEVTLVHSVGGRPGSDPPRAWIREVDGLDEVMAATEALARRHGSGGPGDGWRPAAGPFVLVCTNGRHDSCCATYGRPLVRALRASRWARQLWECSHVGGDRFAGNLILLPDSLYFGRCDEAAADRVLAAYVEGRLDLANFRGRSTYRLPEQAVEHFVRRERGLDRLDAIAGIERDGVGRFRVTVREGERLRTLDVALGRRQVAAPSPLTCKGADGLEYPSFHLLGIEER